MVEKTVRVVNGKIPVSVLPNDIYTTTLKADSISYNSDGTVASTTEGGIVTSYTYNADGTVNTETRLGKRKTWAYDSSGNPTSSSVANV